MSVLGGYTNGFTGFGQAGAASVEWPRAVGPLDAGGHAGFPARRRHSLGRILSPPSLATPPATDTAALALLEEIPALLSTSDVNLRRFPTITRTQATAERTWADQLTLAQAEALERNAYPERWRGPMPAVAEFANAVHQWLTIGVPHGAQTSPVRSITSELGSYLVAARTGQLAHAAVASPAFQSALRNAYELAWLTHHLRQGHGEVLRTPVYTGNPSDLAWRYTDEANDLLRAGFVAQHRVDWRPGDHTVAVVAFLENALTQDLVALRHDLAQALVPEAPVDPRLAPGVPGRLGLRMMTGVLLGALGWMLWQRYGRGGRGWRWRRGTGQSRSATPATPADVRELLLV